VPPAGPIGLVRAHADAPQLSPRGIAQP